MLMNLDTLYLASWQTNVSLMKIISKLLSVPTDFTGKNVCVLPAFLSLNGVL